MEQGPVISSDDSCDSEMINMKTELNDFGLNEENLSKEEMRDLLRALKDSKTSAREDEFSREKKCAEKSFNVKSEASKETKMRRKYLNVRDRRMPWSILPNTLTQAEKARTLAVYIKLMSINNYRQARQSIMFAAWPPPIQIVEEATRVQPVRSTRSGRSMPIYTGFDDDSSDFDLITTKSKKRKLSNGESHDNDGIYSNKVVSLKRKSPKEDISRPAKEDKLHDDSNNLESFALGNNLRPKRNIFTIIED